MKISKEFRRELEIELYQALGSLAAIHGTTMESLDKERLNKAYTQIKKIAQSLKHNENKIGA